MRRVYDRERYRRRKEAGWKKHTEQLQFNARHRPFDPVEAAEHIRAVFQECPPGDKAHLLARIKILVQTWDSVWGGFRFED